ncbi:MAG TPA: hypothetical protein VFD24_11390 [Chitinophagaceae bacterium]|nr:hypothetical protein [Chitinophagaceae bacterium]
MLVAYVSFNGNTEEAFNFYKSALGGNITNVQRFGDSPDGGQMADADKKRSCTLHWKLLLESD